MDRPIRLSREMKYEGKLVKLHVDRVRLPSGRETTREIIEHPDAVVILPVTREGTIWFVRQYRYAISQELLELPAGLVDPGETPIDAAHRELREEVGLVTPSIAEIGLLYPSAGYSNECVHIYFAQDCTPVERPDLDEGLALISMGADELTALAGERLVPFQNAATAFAVLWYVNNRNGMP